MPTPRKPTKRKKNDSTDQNITKAFLREFKKKIDAKEGGTRRKISKGEALVKTMVNEALKGDQRMLVNILKIIDKFVLFQPEVSPQTLPITSKEEWEMLFAFFGKYDALIRQEIEKRKITNPSYWSFEWYSPKLESAPWYKDVYG